MLKNAFIGRTIRPTESDLSLALGSARVAWDQLLAGLVQAHGVETHEWKCHSVKWGWSLRVTRKQRTIVWLSPGLGGFNVLFILGDKAVRAARETRLPPTIMRVLDAAPKYPEGTGLRFVMKSPRLLAALQKIAAIKVAN